MTPTASRQEALLAAENAWEKRMMALKQSTTKGPLQGSLPVEQTEVPRPQPAETRNRVNPQPAALGTLSLEP